MTEREWSKLCRSIYEQKCILMLGAQFPIEVDEAGAGNKSTTIGDLLFNEIGKELLSTSRLPANYDTTLKTQDICQLARDFIYYSDSNQIKSREELETLISDYLSGSAIKINSAAFKELAALPFYFIVDTNYGNTFYNMLAEEKKPRKGYYNFKGPQVTVSNMEGSYKKIGSEKEPFIYNLYGSANEPKSMALSDYDLIQLLSNIISKTPGLPADVRAELAHEETCILFIGFGMLNKNWYFRILLHALTSGNKKTMSYALDYLSNINYDQDPTVLFFKDELKVCMYQYDQQNFIHTLTQKFGEYNNRQEAIRIQNKTDSNERIETMEDIKVFISYKREDIETVRKITQRLQVNNLNVLWDQDEEFTGDYRKKIESMIESADAFILMQSSNLKEEPVTYVYVEIRLAMERSNRYAKIDSYLFPAFIDKPGSRLTDTDFNFIDNINNWDLTTPEAIDRMSKEIIRNKVRNKKSNAA